MIPATPGRPWRNVPTLIAGLMAAWALVATPSARAQQAPQPAPESPPPPQPEEAKPAEPDASEEPPASQEAELILKDGRRVSGMLIEQTKDTVRLSIAGVPTTFPQDSVDRVRILPSVEERYAALRGAISDEDVDGILRLAEWLRARERFDLALSEIDRALAVDPNNGSARDLKVLVTEQKKLMAASRPAGRHEATPRPAQAQFPLLTEDQINLIRVYEIDLKDPPRMIIPRDLTKRFLDRYAGKESPSKGPVPVTPEGREVFMRQRPADILAWFFDFKAREFYPEVKVLENPRSLQSFRDRVHRTWLINSCATSHCHGGENAGRLYLFNRQSNSDRTVYTNFLILDRFRLPDGTPLINYTEPARSPLLEMGLPRDQAVFKHPEASMPGARWKPVFLQGRTDDRFNQAVEWIRSMYPEHADYPINYAPPTPKEPPAPGPR